MSVYKSYILYNSICYRKAEDAIDSRPSFYKSGTPPYGLPVHWGLHLFAHYILPFCLQTLNNIHPESLLTSGMHFHVFIPQASHDTKCKMEKYGWTTNQSQNH
jgi:hypothetical protein